MLSFPRKQIMVSLHRNQVFEIPLKSKNNLANVLSIPKNQHGKWKKGGLWHLMFTSSCTIWQLCKFVFTSSCTKLGNHRKVVCEKKGCPTHFGLQVAIKLWQLSKLPQVAQTFCNNGNVWQKKGYFKLHVCFHTK